MVKGDIQFLSPLPALFFFPFSFHPFLSLSPSPSLGSLREWSTIKDLIKTPEQAKAHWQRASTTSASCLAPMYVCAWCACVCACVCVCVYMYVCMHVCVSVQACFCVCVATRVCMCFCFFV